MQLDITLRDGLVVLTPLVTRIDMTAAADFQQALLIQLREGHRRLVVNLERVEYIDSSGLGAFVSAIANVGSAGDITVFGLTSRVRRTFEVTHVNRMIHVADGCPVLIAAAPPTSATTSAVMRAPMGVVSAAR